MGDYEDTVSLNRDIGSGGDYTKDVIFLTSTQFNFLRRHPKFLFKGIYKVAYVGVA